MFGLQLIKVNEKKKKKRKVNLKKKKESACNVGGLGSILGLGRSPGGGHGIPLQYSCLENPVDRGAWRAAVHVFAKSGTPQSSSRQAFAVSFSL